MNPITENPKPIFPARALSLIGFCPAGSPFSPLRAQGPKRYATLTHYGKIYMLSEVRNRLVLGQIRANLSPSRSSTTLTHPLLSFNLKVHSCNEIEHRYEKSLQITNMGRKAVVFGRPNRPNRVTDSQCQQAVRFGFPPQFAFADCAADRPLPRRMASFLAKEALRKSGALAQTLGTVSLKEIYA